MSEAQAGQSDILLTVTGLRKYFPLKAGILQRTVGQLKAVEDVSFTIKRGETFSLVGESGCGKSTTGRTIIRLYEPTAGRIVFDGQDVSNLDERQLGDFRRQTQMIFQDPYSSLNPRKTIGTILAEPFHVHGLYSKAQRRERVEQLLQRVSLSPDHRNRYPHEFSGGQRQRIGIARALALEPKLVIGDEPVSALDVSIQSQILNLFEDLQAELGLTYLFIAHDLAVVKHISDRIGVMYLGRLMEVADKPILYSQPLHPYTQALLTAVPRAHPARERQTRTLLKGEPPSPANPPSGCVFRTRCPHAMERCAAEVPQLRETQPGQSVACHLHD